MFGPGGVDLGHFTDYKHYLAQFILYLLWAQIPHCITNVAPKSFACATTVCDRLTTFLSKKILVNKMNCDWFLCFQVRPQLCQCEGPFVHTVTTVTTVHLVPMVQCSEEKCRTSRRCLLYAVARLIFYFVWCETFLKTFCCFTNGTALFTLCWISLQDAKVSHFPFC